MPDVPNATLETETDYDYAYTYAYDYGVLDQTLRAIAAATATTAADSLAIGSGAATSTADATTDATTAATGTGETTATALPQTTASTTATSAGATTATADATTTASTVATDATSDTAPIDFRVTRDGTEVEDAVYDVAPLTDTANPFGDYCVIKMDDRGGQKFEVYGRGTRIDVAISTNAGITYENRFTGYVVERRETEQSGADVLEVEAYTFDQFLRRNTVTNDQTGNLISEALEDIITTDTPVSYVAGNINVGDDQELTRGYQGVSVEETLRDLAFKSNNEEFGVNDSLEFFFRPQETTHIDRGVDNSQWFNYDIPELGKEAINEVEVWFNGGDESVIVDDGTDKLDLQDNLGLPSPGTQRHELNRPLITDIGDAEDIGRKYLAFRNSTLSGTVTTYGLYEASPGDTISITIKPRGIDTEFLIAATEYRWGRDQTILTVVEKRGDVDDILTELNDSVQRVEMNGANRDAPSNRITTTQANAIVDVSVDADGNTPSGVRFVNDGRRAVRDAWTGESPPTIDTIAVGSDGGALSRSNTSLNNQSNSASATETLPTATSVEYTASITQTGVEEVGLLTTSGALIARAVFDSPVDLAGSVSVTLDVSNDDSVSRGVLTSGGQTAVRDCLADNSPAVPDAYAYGSDNTPVSESDTALGNELVETSLSEILIQEADTQTDWNDLLSDLPDTTPIAVDSTGPYLAQTSFTTEAEDADRFTANLTTGWVGTNGEDFSGGDSAGLVFQADGHYAEFDFTTEYTIPGEDFDIYFRWDKGGDAGANNRVEFTIQHDGVTESLGVFETTGTGTTWQTGGLVLRGSISDVSPGTHTLRVEQTEDVSGQDDLAIDVVAPVDTRYTYTIDNSVGPNGFLDGPELRPPNGVEFSLPTSPTRRNVTTANFELSANDTSGEFYVELSNDGTTYTRVSNSETGSVTFSSPERGVDARLSLDAYGSRTTATPKQGYLGQQIDTWSLFANPDATVSDSIQSTVTRAVIPPGTITGSTVREAGMKGGADVLLTRHILAEFDVLAGQRLASAEESKFSGTN